MARVSDAVLIDRPPDVVFAALANPAVQMTYDGEMLRSVEKLTPGPIGKGTRFRSEFKGMGNTEYDFAEFDEPDLLEVHVGKVPFGALHHRFEFMPQGTGTRLTQSITVTPNLLGRLLWPLVIRRMMSARVQTLSGLVKQYAER
jgi:hypothetical protein